MLSFPLLCAGELIMVVYMRFRSFPVSDLGGASRTVVRGPGRGVGAFACEPGLWGIVILDTNQT